MPGQQSSSQEPLQIQIFRRRFSLPLTGPCPLQTVVGCLWRHSHYFAVIINPSNKTMHVLGRSRVSNNFVAQPLAQVSWDWDLSEVWSKVAMLHGWDFDLDFNVYELNWEQNGNDCGPIVCQVLEHIWIHGFRVSASGRWLKPESLPCCHFIRRQIISDFQVQVLDWSRVDAWAVLDPSDLDMTGAVFRECREMVSQFDRQHFQSSILRVQQEMDCQARSCVSCCPPNSLVEQSTSQLEPSPPRFLHKRQISKPSVNWLPLPAPPPADSEPDDDESSEADVPPLRKKKKVQKPRNPHPYALDRFPRPTSPPLPTVLRNSDALFLSSERPYDDYENGPTSEVLNPIPNAILMLGEIDLVYLADNIISNPWRTFIDYGYRLRVDFCQAFKRQVPFHAHQNLMPVGLKGPPSGTPSPGEERPFPFPELLPLDQSRHGGPYEFHDSCNLGPNDMIRLAKEQDDNLIFLTGKISGDEESYINLDLEKDAVHHESVQVEKAIDIDSVIWVTRHPRFRNSISVFTKPVIRSRPPIFKHNHVFVKLLLPQSEVDRSVPGARQEWVERKIKLCNIPHVFFGKMAGDLCNLYLAFPRMYHKHPYINRFESLVPPRIQNILWEQLIIPAMELATPDVSQPYVGLDLSHLAMKSSSKQMASYPFRPHELSKLLLFMGNLVSLFESIADSDGKLDQFGSFFFVLEAKGIKALTKEMVSSHDGSTSVTLKYVLDNLRKELNSLDWNYMADRSRGELFVDLGITYHPKGASPLVGLWRLDHLEASYGAGGYNLGNMHHHNTLSHYGGLQAEMSVAQSDQSHVIFRSSYNLAYEAVRRADNSRERFKDTDVCSISERFMQEKNQLIHLFKGAAQTKSYGLRDEFRLGYSALQPLGDHLGETIRDFESSTPFIWLPSKTWFEFLWRRLESLFQCQMQLYHRKPHIPTNYGLMSTLFAFLMQSTLFTPPFIRPQLKESLTSLNFSPLVNRFGMFFLHDLDMSKELCLPEVAEVDDLDLLTALGFNPDRARQALRQDQLRRLEDDQNNEEIYPLGENLTWNELKGALSDMPGIILRKWSWPGDLDNFCHPEGLAADLFKVFTAQIWAALNSAYKLDDPSVRRRPDSLQEAMACWSLDSLHARLRAYVVIPCNCPVRGKGRGPRAPSFEERTSLYFVEAAQDLKKRNHWAPFAQNPGYIAKYRSEKSKLDDDDKVLLDLALGKMLSYCQCLPNSKLDNAGGIWDVKRGKVVLLSNPHYWKLRMVGLVPTEKRRARGAPAHATNRQLSRSLLELEGYNAEVTNDTLRMEVMIKKMRTKNRTGRAKNLRVPPKRGASKALIEEGDRREVEQEEENERGVAEDSEDTLADIELSEEDDDSDF
ncbi:hypothetical protein F5887DRAFT_901684 [Amanita rubescens]|nr:hypothetical protein F5887DRAFT_901684 [Amanita rubescens]